MKKTAISNCLTIWLCLFTLLCGSLSTAFAKGDVTVTNPLLYSDVPDPDVICVGKDYYMVSTTMHMSPGCPIMHSRDMKNWSIISYVFETLNDESLSNIHLTLIVFPFSIFVVPLFMMLIFIGSLFRLQADFGFFISKTVTVAGISRT